MSSIFGQLGSVARKDENQQVIQLVGEFKTLMGQLVQDAVAASGVELTKTFELGNH